MLKALGNKRMSLEGLFTATAIRFQNASVIVVAVVCFYKVSLTIGLIHTCKNFAFRHIKISGGMDELFNEYPSMEY